MVSSFALPFERLPESLPIFPLSGALLLPRGRLPLQIFEPRYLNMTFAALAEDRMIGMMQSRDVHEGALYDVGCAGRIVNFQETDDGRLLITLEGMVRFKVQQELPVQDGYRRVVPDWKGFESDYLLDERRMDRPRLEEALVPYLKAKGLDADWELVRDTSDEALVVTLAMMCPFSAPEKQALLEADGIDTRAELLVAMLEMALHDGKGDFRA